MCWSEGSVSKPTFQGVLVVLMHSHQLQPLIHLHFFISWYLPGASHPIDGKGDPEAAKIQDFFKSIHLPEIDIASPWILKGESSVGAQGWSSPFKACGYSPCFNRYFDLIKSSATEKSA